MEISIQHARLLRRRQAGLSAVETLLYITIATLLMGSMYQMSQGQQQDYLAQNYITEIQQSLRVGLYTLTKDLRSAGYNPTGRALVGFVASFPAPNDKFLINYATADDMVAFFTDANGNAAVDVNSAEQVAYRHNATNGTMERFVSTTSPAGGTWEVVIDNVDALNFVYLGEDGLLATQSRQIRAVEVALLVRARKENLKLKNTTLYMNKRGTLLCPLCSGDQYHRRLLTTTVQARNCAFTGKQGICNAGR